MVKNPVQLPTPPFPLAVLLPFLFFFLSPLPLLLLACEVLLLLPGLPGLAMGSASSCPSPFSAALIRIHVGVRGSQCAFSGARLPAMTMSYVRTSA